MRDLSVGADDVFVDEGVKAFAAAAAEMDLPRTETVLAQVRSWFTFYRRWAGRRIVGFSGANDIAVKLMADSFAIDHAIPRAQGDVSFSVIDLGSGNGWPGLAARSLWADTRLTLLDSRLGACDFIREYVAWASVDNTWAVPLRAEKAAKMPEFRERYDLVTSRAMAQPGVALELAVPFARPSSGLLALWFGPEFIEQAARRSTIVELGVTLVNAYEYRLAARKGRRLLAVYRRDGILRKGFPRSLSSIKAKPLL